MTLATGAEAVPSDALPPVADDTQQNWLDFFFKIGLNSCLSHAQAQPRAVAPKALSYSAGPNP